MTISITTIDKCCVPGGESVDGHSTCLPRLSLRFRKAGQNTLHSGPSRLESKITTSVDNVEVPYPVVNKEFSAAGRSGSQPSMVV